MWLFDATKLCKPLSNTDPCHFHLLDKLQVLLCPTVEMKHIAWYLKACAEHNVKLEVSARKNSGWKHMYEIHIFNLTRWQGRCADDRYDIYPGCGNTVREAFASLWQEILRQEHAASLDELKVSLDVNGPTMKSLKTLTR